MIPEITCHRIFVVLIQNILSQSTHNFIMKTLRFLLLLFLAISMGFLEMSMVVPGSEGSDFAILPDLRVSAIATPGGLCQGNESKVRVTITNSQMAGVKAKIPVILYVSQQGQQPKSYVGYVSGIGAKDNYGQPVWFNNVEISGTNSVTLKASVNPDQEIEESVYKNNTKVITAKPKNVACGQAPVAQGYPLTVYAQAQGQGGPISGAQITITKSTGQSFSGITGDDGKAVIANLPSGACNIKLVKQGYNDATTYFVMTSYATNKTVTMYPQS